MNAIDFSLLAVPFLAGLLVLSTHVPLGREVLGRGIIFIDLAIAQVAGLGVILAQFWQGEEAAVGSSLTQFTAAGAACAGALLLTWTGRRWPEIQEALIGLLFVFTACAGILLLAHDPHGGEHLTDLLAGQILWVGGSQLILPALLYGALLALWFLARQRLGDAGFYLIFALAVTFSVQLVGVFLVFASLIAPALASRHWSNFHDAGNNAPHHETRPPSPPSGGFDTARSARYHGALRGDTEGLRLAPRAAFPGGGPAGKLVFHTNWGGLALAYGIGALGYGLGLAASALWDLPAGAAIAALLCLLALTGLIGRRTIPG